MKFSDLFLPKIARSDPKVRLKAVQGIQDAELLKRVSQNDSDPTVRDAALRQIRKLDQPVS